MVISITASGYIKRLALSTYRTQGRGGVGVMGMDTKDDDVIDHLFVASTHDYLLFFTTVGKVYRVKVHELPLGTRQSKGRALVNVLPLRQDERVRAVIDTRTYSEGRYLLFATRRGLVKKTEFKAYDTVLKADGIIALKIREGDELVGVRLTDGDDDVLLVSRNGSAVRFSERDVRSMGRDTTGVAGMKLRSGDEVISVEIARDDQDLLVVTENGFGKRTRIAEYPAKGRGTMGVLTIRYTESRGRLAGAMIVRDGYEVMLISQDGTVIRQKAEGISRMGRATQGVRVMNLREGDRLSSIARVTEPQAVVDAGEEGDQPVELDAVEPDVMDPVEDDEAAVETPEEEQPGDLEE
jgi:DNA gyrase subunit A